MRLSIERNRMVSVIIPSYNHARFIGEAIASVWGQSYAPLEIVVVDDNSTDNSPAVIEDLQKKSPIPMKVELSVVNRGINATMGRALELAEGEFVAVLDSDDRYAPGRFEEQIAMFQSRPTLMVIYGNGQAEDETGLRHRILDGTMVRRIREYGAEKYLQHITLHTSPLYWQPFLIRRGFLLDCGGFEKEVEIAGDWSLNIRIFRKLVDTGAEYDCLDKTLFYYRLHGGNTTLRFEMQSKRMFNVIHRYAPETVKGQALHEVYWERAVAAVWEAPTRPFAWPLFRESMKLRFSPRKTRKFFSCYLAAVKRDLLKRYGLYKARPAKNKRTE